MTLNERESKALEDWWDSTAADKWGTESLGFLVDIIADRRVSEALHGLAIHLQTDAVDAWGGDSSWLTTGKKVADLAAIWVHEYERAWSGESE